MSFTIPQVEHRDSAFSVSLSSTHQLLIPVAERISQIQSLPDVPPEKLQSHKIALIKEWNRLILKEGYVEFPPEDQEFRPLIGGLQGILEQYLCDELGNSFTSIVCMIHTPQPATPLCTKGEISKELVAPSIEQDPMRLSTVKKRTVTLRDLLHKGCDVVIAYPKEGLAKRSLEQQDCYQQERNNYPVHLIDCPLNCEEMKNEWIGATYIITCKNGEQYTYGVRQPQANAPGTVANPGHWFCSLNEPSIKEQVNSIYQFIKLNKPDHVNLPSL